MRGRLRNVTRAFLERLEVKPELNYMPPQHRSPYFSLKNDHFIPGCDRKSIALLAGADKAVEKYFDVISNHVFSGFKLAPSSQQRP